MRIPLLALLPLLLSTACSQDAPEQQGPDAGAVELDAAGQTDASLPDTDAGPPAFDERLLHGGWVDTVVISPSRDYFRLTLGETSMRVDRYRDDAFGEFINCATVETWTGEWSVEDGFLNLTPISGRTRREQGPGILDCDEEDLYAERDLTPEEISDRDFLSGEFELDGNRLTVMTGARNWPWDRE